jgi:hypothetical protein
MAKPTKPAPTPRMLTVRKTKEASIVFDPSRGKRMQFYANPEEKDEKKRKRAVYKVPAAPYWHRRLRDGAVELCKDDGTPIDVKAEREKAKAEMKARQSGDVPDMGGKKTEKDGGTGKPDAGKK